MTPDEQALFADESQFVFLTSSMPHNNKTTTTTTSPGHSPTRSEFENWLGHQAWKLDQFLVLEVFAGLGRCSDEIENMLNNPAAAIRIGYLYGHDLNKKYDRWMLYNLVLFFKPYDVIYPWECKFWCSLSNVNLVKDDGALHDYIMQGRAQSSHHLRLYARVQGLQEDGGRHAHAENPLTSMAWRESPIEPLPGYRVKWHQCQTGLTSPDPEDRRPHMKPSLMLTTRWEVAAALGVTEWPEHGWVTGYTCQCPGGQDAHAPLQGRSYKGRPLTSWAEDWPPKLAYLVAKGICEGIQNETMLSWPEHVYPAIKRDREPDDEPPMPGHPGRPDHPTQGRRKSHKYSQDDGGIPAAASTETPAAAVPQHAAAIPEVPDGIPNHTVDTFLRQLHLGAAHATNAEMVNVLQKAGASRELIRRALIFRCAFCEAFKRAKPHHAASLRMVIRFGDQVMMDLFIVELRRGDVQTRANFLTCIDTATTLVVIKAIDGKIDAAQLTTFLRDGWFHFYGPPGELFVDLEGAFQSDEFGQFCMRHRVVLRTIAAEAPWQHGRVEVAQRTLRPHLMTAWATFDEKATVDDLSYPCGYRSERVEQGRWLLSLLRRHRPATRRSLRLQGGS